MAKKGLHTLIRLRKWDVDERQRALGTLLREEEGVLEAQRQLESSLVAERALAAKADPMQRSTFEPFVRRCMRRRDELARDLIEVRVRVAVAQAEMAEAYRRLKTFEITQRERDRAAAKEESRLEQIGLDEMSLASHRRRLSGAAL
jgi:flagellar export protein FliJ